MTLSVTHAVCATNARADQPTQLLHKRHRHNVSGPLRYCFSTLRSHKRFYINLAASGSPSQPIQVRGDLVFGTMSELKGQQLSNPKDQEPAGDEEVIEVSPGRRGKVRQVHCSRLSKSSSSRRAAADDSNARYVLVSQVIRVADDFNASEGVRLSPSLIVGKEIGGGAQGAVYELLTTDDKKSDMLLKESPVDCQMM